MSAVDLLGAILVGMIILGFLLLIILFTKILKEDE